MKQDISHRKGIYSLTQGPQKSPTGYTQISMHSAGIGHFQE